MADYILYDGKYSGGQIDALLDRVNATSGVGALQPKLAGTTAKALEYGQYMTVEQQTESDGSITLVFGVPSGPTGAKGDKGDTGEQGATGSKGDKGDAGRGIETTVAYFARSSSSTVVPTSWTRYRPAYSATNKYLWFYLRTYFDDGDYIETFPVVLSSNGDDGATGPQGPKGDTGAAGKSAYQAAREAGYKGTESEFNALLSTIDTVVPSAQASAESASNSAASAEQSASRAVEAYGYAGDARIAAEKAAEDAKTAAYNSFANDAHFEDDNGILTFVYTPGGG